MKNNNKEITRRGWLVGAFALAMGASSGTTATSVQAATPKPGPGAKYLLKVKPVLLKAGRTHSQQAFSKAISRYADLPAIAHYSLGDYSKQLPIKMRKRYHKGVVRYMAHFFSVNSKRYRVKDAVVLSEEPRSKNEVLVQTRIILESGTVYNVGFLLTKKGRRYRIRDARILGFWLSYFQRAEFTRFIKKNGGRIEILLKALRV